MVDAGPEAVVGDSRPRASDGRTPGRRGLATRQRLLDETLEALRRTSYRDLKVIDITRTAQTSPATFYQYFSDVESAILVLAEEMVVSGGQRFADVVKENPWHGPSGYDGAVHLADTLLEFWDGYRPVLRVVDLATEEGDLRFANIRTRLLNDLNNALATAARDHQRAGRGQPDATPEAIAGVLVAMLAHVSAHRLGFEFWGVRTADLRTTMARIIYWSVTGESPST